MSAPPASDDVQGPFADVPFADAEPMTVDSGSTPKGSIVVTTNTGAPFVTSRAAVLRVIPNLGPMVRPCGACSKPPEPGKQWGSCSQCEVTHYCSKECQIAHWKVHKPMCVERKAQRESIKKDEEDAASEGKVYFSALTTQAWYRKHANVLSYAAFHALEMYRGAPHSLQRTHIAFCPLKFDPAKPKDVDAISLLDVQPLPVGIMDRLGGPAALAHVQRSVGLGYMVIVMANGEDLSALAMEMQLPESQDAYLKGEKKVEENWKMYAMVAVSGVLDRLK